MSNRRIRSPRRIKSPRRTTKTTNGRLKGNKGVHDKLYQAMVDNDFTEVKKLLDTYDLDLSYHNYEALIAGVGMGNKKAVKTLVNHSQFKKNMKRKKNEAVRALATLYLLSNPDLTAKERKELSVNEYNPYNPHGKGKQDWIKVAALLGTGALIGGLLF